MNTQPTITIGIPTYLPRKILIETLKSITNQNYFHLVSEIILVVDGVNPSNVILKKLKQEKLKVLFFKNREGQSQRINDIFKSSTTDLLIITNDDVIWQRDALKHLVETFVKTKADLVSAGVTPLPGKAFLEKVLRIGHLLNKKISSAYNNGDNYLTCNGRLVAVSKKLYKKMIVPGQVWNNDAYMYLFVKIHNFKYSTASSAICYYRSPSRIKEHLKQSKKFLYSFEENSSVFKQDISGFYNIPKKYFSDALISVYKKKPLLTVVYIALSMFIRVVPFSKKLYKKHSYWDTDISTKKSYAL